MATIPLHEFPRIKCQAPVQEQQIIDVSVVNERVIENPAIANDQHETDCNRE
jgi:hypothetical protein